MNKLFFIVIFMITVDTLYSLEISDCGSEFGKFTKVAISECDLEKEHQCILKRHTNVTISINFIPKEDIQKLTTVVHGKILGAWVPFPLTNENACNNTGLQCPLVKDQEYEYHATFEVLGEYPKLSLQVKWELKEQNDKDALCIIIPAKIQ